MFHIFTNTLIIIRVGSIVPTELNWQGESKHCVQDGSKADSSLYDHLLDIPLKIK